MVYQYTNIPVTEILLVVLPVNHDTFNSGLLPIRMVRLVRLNRQFKWVRLDRLVRLVKLVRMVRLYLLF